MGDTSSKCFFAAEEARFLQIRPVVLGAEGVAVAAVVAVVGEVGDLLGVARRETAVRRRSPIKVPSGCTSTSR